MRSPSCIRHFADENVWMSVVKELRRRNWEIRTDVDHAGIIFASQYGHTVGELIGRIDKTLQHQEDRDLSGEVVFA